VVAETGVVVLLIVSVSFVGLAVCLIIIFVGIGCARRSADTLSLILTSVLSLSILKVAGSNLGRSASRYQPWASCSHACASVTKQYNVVPAYGRWRSSVGKVTAHRAESNGSLPPAGWLKVTCGLTACTLGSAPRAQRSVTSMGELYLYFSAWSIRHQLITAGNTWKHNFSVNTGKLSQLIVVQAREHKLGCCFPYYHDHCMSGLFADININRCFQQPRIWRKEVSKELWLTMASWM